MALLSCQFAGLFKHESLQAKNIPINQILLDIRSFQTVAFKGFLIDN